MKLVVIDELSTLYHIQKGSFSELNRKIGLVLYFLKKQAIKRGFTSIVFSSYRYREKEILKSGGRILNKMSETVAELITLKDEVIVSLKDLDERKFRFRLSG
ncbi:MAG: hypothetical protein QXX95_06045 [Nitrososphaerales archaeon]